MSIKGFHLIFIFIASIFCGSFGVWALFINDQDEGTAMTVFGVVTLVFSLALIVYGIYFRRKSKDIIV